MTMSNEASRSARSCIPFLVLLAVPVLSSCTALVGGSVVATVVAVGALTSHCYDYLDVSVYDEFGKKSCSAVVTATNDSSSVELNSCYYAPLTDGNWTLRAAQPGYVAALATVIVEHEQGCTRHVQSVELTLNRPGLIPAPRPIGHSPAAVPALPAPEPSPAPAQPAGPVTDSGQTPASPTAGAVSPAPSPSTPAAGATSPMVPAPAGSANPAPSGSGARPAPSSAPNRSVDSPAHSAP